MHVFACEWGEHVMCHGWNRQTFHTAFIPSTTHTRRACAHAHDADVKPSNVLLDEHHNAKLHDVGVAKVGGAPHRLFDCIPYSQALQC